LEELREVVAPRSVNDAASSAHATGVPRAIR
jgi:hypothetical protein